MNLFNYINKKWNLFNAKFSPELKYEDLLNMPFDEARRRIDNIVDSPMLYSNEPTLDMQAWMKLQTVAWIGNHVMELKRSKGKEAVVKWINNLPD